MTFGIAKSKLNLNNPTFDAEAAKAAIVSGMVNDTVTDIHGAVAVTGAENGDQVEAIYNKLLKELKHLIQTANKSAATGETIGAIMAAINEESINFSAFDIKSMMIEAHGSVAEWKQAMLKDTK